MDSTEERFGVQPSLEYLAGLFREFRDGLVDAGEKAQRLAEAFEQLAEAADRVEP